MVLDSGPLGDLTRPLGAPIAERVKELAATSTTIAVPEIAAYEVRRELLRAGKDDGVLFLDMLIEAVPYLALDSPTMELAAMLWAEIRRDGRPTAPDHALDADVILAAQVQALTHRSGDHVVVATTNPRHLARFCDARRWDEI